MDIVNRGNKQEAAKDICEMRVMAYRLGLYPFNIESELKMHI